ncbi:hypothetical protein RM533_06720 [Croceicoccus sp. F390]|uniref:Uncharacterized protein n=1 Tax=Croceicoccus esteveae TaxID=3075597 RepID=A0ABU2ZGZ6_9SPHN|nr:hypothetical protein [Croceicoccus sp. F390]MDT0575874.1 hypothetical protein [Croceicoccus sp. F390]
MTAEEQRPDLANTAAGIAPTGPGLTMRVVQWDASGGAMHEAGKLTWRIV